MESKPSNGNQGKPEACVDINTQAHAEDLRAHVFNVVIWVTKLLIAQEPHGLIRVIFKDLEWKSTQLDNKIALQLVFSLGNNRDRQKPQARGRAF